MMGNIQKISASTTLMFAGVGAGIAGAATASKVYGAAAILTPTALEATNLGTDGDGFTSTDAGVIGKELAFAAATLPVSIAGGAVGGALTKKLQHWPALRD